MESVIREENICTAYEILSQMCEIVAERAEFLCDISREIPQDMYPHLQTIFYADPLIDIQEISELCRLLQARCKRRIGEDLVNATVKERLKIELYDDEIKMVKL